MKSVVTLLFFVGFHGIFPDSIHKTHIYVDRKLSWGEAQTYCRVNYDDLSTINSEKENDLLSDIKANGCSGLLLSNDCQGRWIGLYKYANAKSSVWKWSEDDEKATFTIWAKENNNASLSNNCTYQTAKNGKWYPASCSLKLTFFCMVKSPQLVLVQRNMTFEEALDYCRNHYTDLASLQSNQQNALAVKKSEAADVARVWIGLHFVVKYWMWVDGHALEYTAWPENEYQECPDRNLRCGALETGESIWKPTDCEENLNFFCYRLKV